MTTEYTIYLVNESLDKKTFWCFLAPPKELEGNRDVFANSSTNLTIASKATSINFFTIPVQYVAGGAASNHALGLSLKVNSLSTRKVDLGDIWEIDYVTTADDCTGKEGPSMKKLSDKVRDDQISLKSNPFNKEQNENCKWYSNMSFGIKTEDGFIGMTWSPSPSETTTLTPKLTFYVQIGEFGSNELASWTKVSNKAAVIQVPDSFQHYETTVTLNSTGGWDITPGAPPNTVSAAASGFTDNLIDSHRSLLAAMTELWGLVKGKGGANLLLSGDTLSSAKKDQTDVVESVQWRTSFKDKISGNTTLTGTITVKTALAAAFAYFILSGSKVRFQVGSPRPDATQFEFSYDGTDSAGSIKKLFKPNAQITFTNDKED